MFEEDQQQEMESVEYTRQATIMQQTEEQYSSIRHCSQCKHNWSRLPVKDEEGDEQYEFCPICRTDAHLTDYSGGDTFTFCQITGTIVNDRTGKPESESPGLSPAVAAPRDPFDAERYGAKKEHHEASEDKALAAYYKAFETGGQPAADKAYRQALNTNLS